MQGPIAKHPSARQRRNKTSTSREIVLSGEIRPVPDLPELRKKVDGQLVAADWHPEVVVAWAEMWQYPLVYEAPTVDRHQLRVYARLLQDFWERADAGRPINETARDVRMMGEQWGVGEKSRRHLQITIQEAEEAIERGRKAQTVDIGPQKSSAGAYTPSWTDEDEDDGSIADGEVVS